MEDVMVDTTRLAGIPLFKDVPSAVLEKISAISEEHKFSKGQIVFREGEKASRLHFLIKGSIALRVNIMTKPDNVTVSFMEKSYECFGWSGLIAPHYYTATAHCEEDCDILTVLGAEL